MTHCAVILVFVLSVVVGDGGEAVTLPVTAEVRVCVEMDDTPPVARPVEAAQGRGSVSGEAANEARGNVY